MAAALSMGLSEAMELHARGPRPKRSPRVWRRQRPRSLEQAHPLTPTEMEMEHWTIVTGGSQGIGAAVCEQMKGIGQKVLMLDIKAPSHGNVDEFLNVDLSRPAEAAVAVGEKLGGRPVNRLLHIAGICIPADLEHTTLENMQTEMNVSTLSLVALAQLVLPSMKKNGWGRIVGTGSRAALGKPERTGYSAAKSALSGIIRSWALEFIQSGITVNIVAPGATKTQLLTDHNDADGWFMKNLEARIPVGFLAEPADIANAVSFLASDQARFITGQVLNVCGGTSIGFAEKFR